MTTRFWCVRHGPTGATDAVGWTDLDADLSDTAKVTRLDAALPTEARLITSDLKRTIQTADALSPRARLQARRDLREIHFGDWEGRNFDEISREAPELSRAYWETPGDIAPPNGESMNALSARVGALIDELIAAHAGEDVIVVAHMGVILSILAMSTGMAQRAAFSFAVDPLSVSRFDHLGEGSWRVAFFNHAP